MRAQFIIRPAHAGDIEALFDIRTGVSQNHLSRSDLDRMGITAESLGEIISAGPSIWVAEIANQAVAFSMIDNQEGSVFAMFVRQGFEGKGLGRRLMAEAERSLFRHHRTIWLVTAFGEHIRANGFYQRLGWQPVGLTEEGDMRYEKRA